MIFRRKNIGITIAETVVHWLAGIFAFCTLVLIMAGIWRGKGQAGGRVSGRGAKWLRSGVFYLLSTACFLVFSIVFWTPLPWPPATEGRVIRLIAGGLFYFSGMGLVLWGRLTLGRMYFVSTSFGVQLFSDHKLVLEGPFSFVRHPMYTGLVIAAWGSLILYFTWTALAFAIFAPFLLLRARREERALEAEFGEEWRKYCRRVPAFLPGLRKKH